MTQTWRRILGGIAFSVLLLVLMFLLALVRGRDPFNGGPALLVAFLSIAVVGYFVWPGLEYTWRRRRS